VETTPRWVRVRAGGRWIADSRRALLLTWYGPGRLPTYCFPAEDVDMGRLVPTEAIGRDGVSTKYDVVTVGGTLPGAARVFHDPPPELAGLRDMITFLWHDPRVHWFEEAHQVHVHAKDPHKRVDAVPSARQVRVELDGVTVAESSETVAVFETFLPTRWYFPAMHVRDELLVPTESVSRCPYKGTARWWSVRTPEADHKDVAWSYPETVVEMPRLAGLVAFLNERVDLFVDGEPQRRPVTPWSFASTGEAEQV
jgi:uncharacterized protein (DUF427 family)